MMMMIKIPLVNWSAIKLMKNQRGGQAQLQQRVHLVNLAEAALLNQEDLVILFPTLVVVDIGLHGRGRIVHLKLHFIHSKTKEVNEYIVIFDPKTIQADYFFYFFFIPSSISNEVATDSRRSSEDMPSVAVSTCTTSSQITYNSTSTMVLNKESLNMLPAMSPISEFSFDYPEESITHGLPIFYY